MANKNVSSRVKLYRPKIRQLTKAMSTALEQTAEVIHDDLEQSQTMPFGKGTMQNESTFVDDTDINEGRVSIISDTPYARRMYYHPEYNFSKKENPNAGARWLDTYLPGGKKQGFAQKVFNKLYKEETGV